MTNSMKRAGSEKKWIQPFLRKRSYPKGKKEITDHSFRKGCDARQALIFFVMPDKLFFFNFEILPFFRFCF